jgi:adenylate cyclase
MELSAPRKRYWTVFVTILTTESRKKQLHEERKSLFSDSMLLMRYANDELIDYIQKTGKNPFETANRKVTILFFDIRNSTGIAESLEPDKFASFLSEIFTDIMDLIYGCGGSVNKLLGDGMMAAFGCPLSTDYDAYNAIKTAVMIQEYLGTYNDVKPDYITQQVEVGIGIATGTVFAGLIGSVHRQEYALLGDSVNIASRLESLTRKTEENILIDENTFLEAERHSHVNVFTRQKSRESRVSSKYTGFNQRKKSRMVDTIRP